MHIKGLSAGLLAAGIVVLGSGCSTTDEMGTLRSMAEQAQSAAAAAQAAADRALGGSQQAQSAAAEADRKATEALRAANDANNCCRQNSEKMDRMFQRSLQK